MTQANSFVDIDALTGNDLAVADVPFVFDEDGNPIAGVKIVSKNSNQYQEAQRAIEMLAVKRAVIKKQQIDVKTDEGAAQYVDIGKVNQIKLASAVVVSMYGFKAGGQDATPSPELLNKIFTSKPTWLTQVSLKLESDSGFLPA
ncbi:hypothetical protein ACO0LB_09980 [Undibacterium sp. SXout7W]|uniref:hypothetical protein n=1 Tax=Undibacterium sp. SXout7W TaxID=3413049 RepID=UPI003BF17466